MLMICNRKVKIAARAKTQTVNICTPANQLGTYQFIGRITPPVHDLEQQLGARSYPSIEAFFAFVCREYRAAPEPARGGAPHDNQSEGEGRDVAQENGLLSLSRDRVINQKSNFVEAGAQLRQVNLREMYDHAMRTAPRRHRAGKSYLTGHNGIPSTTGISNRDEEHLAIAIFNRYGHHSGGLPLPDQQSVHILDYQLPLKEKMADAGVGKVDLFGVSSSGTACIIELKYGEGDTPLRALLEGLFYAALVQANLQDIRRELTSTACVPAIGETLTLCILGDGQYWDCYRLNPVCHGWEAMLMGVTSQIKRQLGIDCCFVDIGFPVVQQGANGRPSVLLEAVQVKPAW